MNIQITGRHMDVGEALRDHAAKIMEGLSTYFSQVIDVNVALETTDRFKHTAEVVVLANGIRLRAEGEGADFYLAIDDAGAKLQRQLEKYKGRLQKHRRRRQQANGEDKAFWAASPMRTVEHTIEEASLEEAPEDLFAEYMPKIQHKTVQDIQALSVDEAVMQMDLMHMPFYIFQNARSQEINVVYRAGEGNTVVWVEPEKNASETTDSAASQPAQAAQA